MTHAEIHLPSARVRLIELGGAANEACEKETATMELSHPFRNVFRSRRSPDGRKAHGEAALPHGVGVITEFGLVVEHGDPLKDCIHIRWERRIAAQFAECFESTIRLRRSWMGASGPLQKVRHGGVVGETVCQSRANCSCS